MWESEENATATGVNAKMVVWQESLLWEVVRSPATRPLPLITSMLIPYDTSIKTCSGYIALHMLSWNKG